MSFDVNCFHILFYLHFDIPVFGCCIFGLKYTQTINASIQSVPCTDCNMYQHTDAKHYCNKFGPQLDIIH